MGKRISSKCLRGKWKTIWKPNSAWCNHSFPTSKTSSKIQNRQNQATQYLILSLKNKQICLTKSWRTKENWSHPRPRKQYHHLKTKFKTSSRKLGRNQKAGMDSYCSRIKTYRVCSKRTNKQWQINKALKKRLKGSTTLWNKLPLLIRFKLWLGNFNQTLRNLSWTRNWSLNRNC